MISTDDMICNRIVIFFDRFHKKDNLKSCENKLNFMIFLYLYSIIKINRLFKGDILYEKTYNFTDCYTDSG